MPVFVPDLISDVELAECWNISPRWLQDRFRSGEFPGRKVSRRWFVTDDDIAEILKRIAIPVKDTRRLPDKERDPRRKTEAPKALLPQAANPSHNHKKGRRLW
jgi:hypothetical protein